MLKYFGLLTTYIFSHLRYPQNLTTFTFDTLVLMNCFTMIIFLSTQTLILHTQCHNTKHWFTYNQCSQWARQARPRKSLAQPMGNPRGLDYPEPPGFVRPEPNLAGPAYRQYRLCTSCLIGLHDLGWPTGVLLASHNVVSTAKIYSWCSPITKYH